MRDLHFGSGRRGSLGKRDESMQARIACESRHVGSHGSVGATLTLLDLTNQAPVQGTYHIEVDANTNDVSLITLFSTGGALAAATNDPAPIFEVDGTNLWAGLHPFYALVETASGLNYRTATKWIRLVNGP